MVYNKNDSTIVDQYTINPNTTNSNSTNLHNGFGSTNFSNIGFSEPVSQDHSSSYIKKFNERHDAFEARSKLFTLSEPPRVCTRGFMLAPATRVTFI